MCVANNPTIECNYLVAPIKAGMLAFHFSMKCTFFLDTVQQQTKCLNEWCESFQKLYFSQILSECTTVRLCSTSYNNTFLRHQFGKTSAAINCYVSFYFYQCIVLKWIHSVIVQWTQVAHVTIPSTPEHLCTTY